MLFQTIAIAKAHASLRDQLQSWLIPRKRQHQMRVARSIQVNGHYRHFNEPVVTGDRVAMTYDEPIRLAYVSETPHLNIRFEDDNLLIVDKPAGMKTHPNQPGETGTLMNQAAAYLAPQPALITHRLDMATSGLLVIAKNPLAQASLIGSWRPKPCTATILPWFSAASPKKAVLTHQSAMIRKTNASG